MYILADGSRRPVSPASTVASKVKVTRSRSPSDRCWPISRERKVLETAKLVTARAITRSRFEVKMSKVNVTRPINAETESVSPTNFKLVRRLELALSNAMGRYKGRLSSCYCTLAGNTVSATPGSHKTCTQLIHIRWRGNQTSWRELNRLQTASPGWLVWMFVERKRNLRSRFNVNGFEVLNQILCNDRPSAKDQFGTGPDTDQFSHFSYLSVLEKSLFQHWEIGLKNLWPGECSWNFWERQNFAIRTIRLDFGTRPNPDPDLEFWIRDIFSTFPSVRDRTFKKFKYELEELRMNVVWFFGGIGFRETNGVGIRLKSISASFLQGGAKNGAILSHCIFWQEGWLSSTERASAG